jgi:nicotinate phosphoribosyltransferase
MTADALFTDYYELTMTSAYLQRGMLEPAAFELFVRALPPARGFLVAAGLEQALDYLERLSFDEEDLAALRDCARLDPALLGYLKDLRFTGDVDAVPEGTVVFEDEPLIRVVAPMPEAQIVETRLINLIQLQTVLASKAARSVLAAPGKVLVDFGVRRAQGLEAGLFAARASYIVGFSGTSLTLAGTRFGIPLYGTMAHSFVQAHDDEAEAFRAFARAHPDDAVLLIDTYDTECAARKVVQLAREGVPVRGVRLDSGDLLAHARAVRRILDDGGLERCGIFASGGLDEAKVRALVEAGSPIDGFGIGTKMDTSADAPYLDCAYKLVEYAGRPKRKRSEGKATWPGRKQVYRRMEGARMLEDAVTLEGEPEPGEPLLVPVMRGGRRLSRAEPLADVRRRAAEQLLALPEHLRALDVGPAYRVSIAEPLRRLAEQLDRTT